MAVRQEMERPGTYRADLDGMRAVAIVAVVLYHAGVPWVRGGYTGVDLFFVLSGYLIGGQILAAVARGEFSFLEFYRRRARRILPALFVTLALTLVAGVVLLSPWELTHLARFAMAATLSVGNLMPSLRAGYFNTHSEEMPLLHTWSLGVEEQFYLVVPLLLVSLARLRRGRMVWVVGLMVALSFAWSCVALADAPWLAFYGLAARGWELGAGVLVALWWTARAGLERDTQREVTGAVTNVASVAALALVVAPMVLYTPQTPFPGLAAMPSVVGAGLLILTRRSWLNRRLLSVWPLVAVGRVSYAWYLLHWPLFGLYRVVSGGAMSLWAGLTLAAVSLALAVVLWRWVEQPLRASTRPAAALLLRYAGVACVLLLACVWLLHTRGLAGRYPMLAQAEAEKAAFQQDPCLVATGAEIRAQCVATGDRPAIALWGDSHAASLAPAMRERAQQAGYGLAQFTHAACPPLQGAVRLDADAGARAAADCAAFNQRALQAIVTDAQVSVVVLEASWGATFEAERRSPQLAASGAQRVANGALARSEETTTTALPETVKVLEAAGKRVVVCGDFPNFALDPMWRLRTTTMPARGLLYRRMNTADPDPGTDRSLDAEPSRANARAKVKALAESSGAATLDLAAPFCDGPVCRYRAGATMLFVDEAHLSGSGAALALEGWQLPALR